MRIAIVSGPHVPIPPIKYGGTEQVIHYLIKGLVEAGHEPILLGPGDSSVTCELVPIVDKAIGFPQTRRQLPKFAKLQKEINKVTARKLKSLQRHVDIIHSHGFDLKKFSDFPNVTTLHNKTLIDDINYLHEREDLYFVSISKNQQEAHPELKYVGVVYNGEDPLDFPLIKRPNNYLCFLGRFDRDKNPHLAIQLAIKLNMKIKVAGKIDFQAEGYFQEEVAKYFDHPLVEYMGELEFKDKIKLLSHAKCNLHPTGFREPFGLTVLEAAYCGTPTLAIAQGSMPELIREGKTGVLVEDFIEGYHQINQCFAMNREYIAKRARRLFNYKNMTRDYIKAYRRVINEFENRK
jgi:glycosyltransferase involved in cell wall biosynthesis